MIPPGRRGPREIPPIRGVAREVATDVGLTPRSAGLNELTAFSHTPILDGREKMGVLKLRLGRCKHGR